MRRATYAVASVLLAALVAGCGTSSGGTTSTAPAAGTSVDPKLGAVVAKLPSETITPVATDPVQQLPATVVSHDYGGDKEVTITDTSRVVAMDLSGSIAGTVWGLGFGSTLVGRDVAASFPGVTHLPVVTEDGHAINAEAVLALKPTLVITDGSIGPRDVVEQLRGAGIKVVFLEHDSTFAGAAALAKEVADVYGSPEVGTELAQRITSQVNAAEASVHAPATKLKVMFLYLRGQAGVYYIFGKGSGADDLIDAIGGDDVAHDEGWGELTPLTDEAMVKANPDVILVMTDGLSSVGGVDGLLKSKPAVALTNAGKNRRFVAMADTDILSFGPRSGEVISALAKAVYGR